MKPIRILHAFSTFAIGGSQVRFARLAAALGHAYEHDVTAMDAESAGFPATGLVPGEIALRTHTIRITKSRGFDPGNILRFRRFLEKRRPDIVLTYNFGSIEWALANRLGRWTPHIHFEDGFGPDESTDRQLPRRVFARRLAIGPRSNIVAPSTGLVRVAAERWGFAADQVRHVPNGVEIADFEASPTREELRGRPDELVIGSVGALRPEKNYPRLISAVASLGAALPVRLVLVGDGPEMAALKSYAEGIGAGGIVDFIGARRDVARFYAGFDIFALSSDTEQMPLSVLEAMAAGRPTLATDVGDIRTMLANDNAPFVTPLGHDAAYASALRRLALDDDLRRRIGAANRERVRNAYSIESMVARYDDLFRSVVVGRG